MSYGLDSARNASYVWQRLMLAPVPNYDTPSLVTLKLRRAGELLPWYLRGLSDDHLIRSEEQGPATCASCGGGTWMELYGEPACHECVDRLRFAGYPLGFREAVKKGNYAWPTP